MYVFGFGIEEGVLSISKWATTSSPKWKIWSPWIRAMMLPAPVFRYTRDSAPIGSAISTFKVTGVVVTSDLGSLVICSGRIPKTTSLSTYLAPSASIAPLRGSVSGFESAVSTKTSLHRASESCP